MKSKERWWDGKDIGNSERCRLNWSKDFVEFTAEDVVWYLLEAREAGHYDGNLSFTFKGVFYRIYACGPACAFHPAPDDPEFEFLESHEWDTWGELMETIRWKNGKTLSEMLRTLTRFDVKFDRSSKAVLRYTPKDAQALPENAPPANTPES